MFNNLGRDWLIEQIEQLTDHIEQVTPQSFSEEYRYLPESVSSIPGPISFDVNPFMVEILNCADVNSPVREVNLKKGVQITYTTLLESIIFYFMAKIKTVPVGFITADKELVTGRVESNILPMLEQSGFSHIIQSSDVGNTRKTGKTKQKLEFAGGGYLLPLGAKNADKMRTFSLMVILKDEIDGWAETVGKDGDPDKLTDARAKGYWERRKIFRGSTPLLKHSSKIDKNYKLGDQRKYFVKCKKCRTAQFLVWSGEDKDTGHKYGIMWDMADGVLDIESVRYVCKNPKCGAEHYEHDKERLFSLDHGAEWRPTAKPSQPGIRSYHLPALYSPIGMAPWYSLVADYLEAWDVETNKVKDMGKYQVFYNNVLAEVFEQRGDKVRFESVSAHRRSCYRSGQIPNEFAEKYSGSKILFLTCQVDVHKMFLAVSVMGWTRGAKCYVIDYFRVDAGSDEDQCPEIGSSVWAAVNELIEEKVYTSDDGIKYKIMITLIDSGYANDTVVTFCSDWASGVYPILGRERPGKNQRIKEFDKFTTSAGTEGYKILVDHYKDRLSPVLKRQWHDDDGGQQKQYHFNAPIDITDKQLKELTVESRKKKIDENGNETFFWHRPGNARNELWDLLVYGHAAVEIIAWNICIQHFELETVNWLEFWDFMEQNLENSKK